MNTPQNSTGKFNIPSFDEVLSKLESAKQEYNEFDKGHRKALYQSMQQVAEAAAIVVVDEKIESRFCKKMAQKDALYAALIFIFDAKSTGKKKEASKRAMALRYLIVRLKVPIEDIADAIPNHGGIEKLARLDAKSRQEEMHEDQADEDQENQNQDEPEEADENDKDDHKFGKRISVGLSPKLTKKLNTFADKTKVKIIGYVRLSSDESPTIEAEKIIEVGGKKKSSKTTVKKANKTPDDDECDWHD